MKKFLLTAALVLALVTSLTAGTMAFYTTTIGTINTKNMTKSFSLTADKSSAGYTEAVELAPGDKAVYTIKVKNASEVNTVTNFVAKLTNGASLPGLSVTVVREPGVEAEKDALNAKTASQSTGTGSDAVAPKLDGYMTIGSTDKYTVTVEWVRGDAWDATTTAGYQNKNFHLSFDISGYQAEGEKITYTVD